MPNTPPHLMANGDILPSRFVMMDTSADEKCIQATANKRPIGISMEGTNYPPLSDQSVSANAAEASDEVRLYGDGDVCLLVAGAAIVRGALLKSDAAGRGTSIATTGTTVQHHGAMALESASAAGEKIRVQVQIGSMYPATY